jgi:hypothetical protein
MLPGEHAFVGGRFEGLLDDLYVGADFRKQARKATRQALSRISTQLTVH